MQETKIEKIRYKYEYSALYLTYMHIKSCYLVNDPHLVKGQYLDLTWRVKER